MKVITEEEDKDYVRDNSFRFFSYSEEKPGLFGAGNTREESEQSFLDGLEALEESEE